jgi:biopolymer transport protein ExbB/TolQ
MTEWIPRTLEEQIEELAALVDAIRTGADHFSETMTATGEVLQRRSHELDQNSQELQQATEAAAAVAHRVEAAAWRAERALTWSETKRWGGAILVALLTALIVFQFLAVRFPLWALSDEQRDQLRTGREVRTIYLSADSAQQAAINQALVSPTAWKQANGSGSSKSKSKRR